MYMSCVCIHGDISEVYTATCANTNPFYNFCRTMLIDIFNSIPNNKISVKSANVLF